MDIIYFSTQPIMSDCWACKADTKDDDKVINIYYKLDGKETTTKICHLDSCLNNFYKWIYHPKFCPCPRCEGMILGLGCINCSKRINDNAKWTIGSFIDKNKQISMRLFCSDNCDNIYGKVFDGICGVCAKEKLSVTCEKCNTIKYCSNDCLKKDAERHSKMCAKFIERFVCANCQQRSKEELSHCAKCKSVYYCSQKCQKAHWKKEPFGHKLNCQKLE